MNFFETSGWRIGSLFGVDISLSMGFLFIVVINMALAGVYTGLIFAITLFVSLVIHEMGHAIVAKRYDLEPSVLLHGFGGLCFHRPAATDGQDAFIVVMGPLAQIGAGLAVLGLSMAVALPQVAGDLATTFVWISLLWGGLNLCLPIYPLDGGKLFHLLLRRFTDSSTAMLWALRVSMGVSIPLGVLALVNQWYIGALLVAFIVMDNYNMMRSGEGNDRPQKKAESAYMRELIGEATEAFDGGDFREAYRLCHLARSTKETMAPKTQQKMWEVLALSSVELGEIDEARGWLKRAPDTAAVIDARSKVASLNAFP